MGWLGSTNGCDGALGWPVARRCELHAGLTLAALGGAIGQPITAAMYRRLGRSPFSSIWLGTFALGLPNLALAAVAAPPVGATQPAPVRSDPPANTTPAVDPPPDQPAEPTPQGADAPTADPGADPAPAEPTPEGGTTPGPAPTEPVAPPPPSGTVGSQAAASSGSTELGGQGTFATAAAPAAEESADATEFTLSAGGILSTGNARSGAATGGATLRLRRDIHQFSSALAGNYATAAVEDEMTGESDWEQTVGNVQGRARYDMFFAERWSAFLMATARHDPFQGLDLRLNVDPGVAFYALNKANHRLWFEAGYDFQYDVRSDDAIDEAAQDPTAEPVDKTQTNHAARLFAGYDNRLHEQVVFTSGVEYLQSLVPQQGARFRLNWDTSLATQLFNQFSLAFTFTLRYENDPLPEVEKLDTVTSLNLVYKFP